MQNNEQFPSPRQRNIEQAAQALAQGDLVIIQVYTPGLLVNGADEQALQKLFAAKRINYARALEGKRPIISFLPDKEHRHGLVAVQKHHPEIQLVAAYRWRVCLAQR